MKRESSLKVALTDEVRGALSFQSYDPAPEIAGVRLIKIRKHHGENGWFAELLRVENGEVAVSEPQPRFRLRQVSAAYAEPGRVNAFHIHPREAQDEIWIVLQGSLLVCLVDCRKGSATEGVQRRYVLSAEDPGALHIPAGVAHGYRAGAGGGLLVYAMNQQFDASNPNEGRLPWDHFGADLWAEDRG